MPITNIDFVPSGTIVVLTLLGSDLSSDELVEFGEFLNCEGVTLENMYLSDDHQRGLVHSYDVRFTRPNGSFEDLACYPQELDFVKPNPSWWDIWMGNTEYD